MKCIYIDPPYNTEKDRAEGKFLYKDTYPFSSWNCMFQNRVEPSKLLLADDGFVYSSIDDTEFANLNQILDSEFGKENFIASVIWHNSSRSSGDQISTVHEYILTYAKNSFCLESWSVPRTEFNGICHEVKNIFKKGLRKQVCVNNMLTS